MDSTIVNLFNEYQELAGSAEAAATLVLAQVQAAARTEVVAHARNTLMPPEVDKELGVDPATAISCIRSTQLKGSNICRGQSRPRYRIRRSDLDTFLASRQPQSNGPTKRSQRQGDDEMEFF
jgi:hypothetical protein